MNKKDYKEILRFEKALYLNELLYSNSARDAWMKQEPPYRIWKWLRLSRITDYYRSQMYSSYGICKVFYRFLYFVYINRKHRLGERLGLEIGTSNIGKGFVIYHYNNVVNGNAIIGENCHLHGDNVIGNNGKTDDAPFIGNNVMLGAGAKVIGGITIADNIKIAAGAVVVHSFFEPGITLAGIPARKVIKKND